MEETSVTDTLHIALFGGINSGKTSLVNALIGLNILPMGSDQGTTAVPIHIRKGDCYELKMCFTNGHTTTYKNSCLQLVRYYMPHIYKKLGWFRKGLIMLKDIFGIRGADSFFFNILKLACTIDSEKIDCLRLICPSPSLPYGVDLIDLPAFDSFLYASYKERVLKELSVCDVILVTMTPDKLLDSDIVLLLKNNRQMWGKYLSFVVNMADTSEIHCKKEIMESLNKLVEDKLGIREAPIHTVSSLLFLSENGLLNAKLDFSHINKKWRETLTTDFVSFCEHILNLRNESNSIRKRGDCAFRDWENAKIEYAAIEQKITFLESEFDLQHIKLQRKILSLKKGRKLPFDQFSEQYIRYSLEESINVLLELYKSKVRESRRIVVDSMKSAVERSSTKNEAQSIDKCYDVLQAKNECEEMLFEAVSDYMQRLRQEYVKSSDILIASYKQNYGSESKVLCPEYEMSGAMRRNVKWHFSKHSMTTMCVLRAFKSLQTIKSEVIKVVEDNVDNSMKDVLNYYYKLLNDNNNRWEFQYGRFIAKFVKKNSIVIKQIIEKENETIEEFENKMRVLLLHHNREVPFLEDKKKHLSTLMSDIKLNVLSNSIFGGTFYRNL